MEPQCSCKRSFPTFKKSLNCLPAERQQTFEDQADDQDQHMERRFGRFGEMAG